MKISFLFLFFGILFARDNPFLPTKDFNQSQNSTNIVEQFKDFESQNIKFPSDAMIFLDLQLKYKAQDGSVKTKIIDINKSINTNEDYVFKKKSKVENLESKKDISEKEIIDDKKEVFVNKMDLNSTKEKMDNKIIPNISKENCYKNEHKICGFNYKEKNNFKSIKAKNLASVEIRNLELQIISKFKIKRHFIYNNKLVIDFDTKINNFYTLNFDLNTNIFKNLKIGHHKNYFRMSFEFDGSYAYIKNANKFIFRRN